MIQRIQSIYLLLTTLLPFLFLKFKILRFFNSDGSGFFVKFRGLYSEGQEGISVLVSNYLSFSALIILIPVCSAMAISLYKKRKLQMRVTLFIILLAAGLIVAEAIIGWTITGKYNVAIAPDLMMTIPFLVLLFSILAFRGIKKDEDLVKSYDRLR